MFALTTDRLRLTRSVSEGMPQAQPGQVIVQQPAPTPLPPPEIVPTREVGPPEPVSPTEQPMFNPPPLTGNEGTSIPGVEPQPVDPNIPSFDTSGVLPEPSGSMPPASGIDESVQPYPVGSRPTTNNNASNSSSNSNTGSAGVRCGRRVVHVVQPGENIFRIALRYYTTINAIVWRNGINDVRFVPSGKRLVIVTCEQR